MLPTNPLLNATAPAGPHLPTATLRQYAAGTLAPATRHRVEAHTLACPRCADILDGLLQTTPATTDQALAQLQQRLRRRVQQTAPAALPATRTRHRHRWLIPQLAVAASLLFGLLAGGWWTWQQRHSTPTASPATPAAAAASVPSMPPIPVPAAPQKPVAQVARPARRVAPLARARGKQAARSEVAGAAAAVSEPANEPLVAAMPPPGSPSSSLLQEQVSVAAAEEPDTTGSILRGRAAGVAALAPAAKRLPPAASALVRDRAMPAAPPVPPTPVAGYPAWREKIRREAAEFEPEEKPLSGSVQLRVTVGADGKVQEIRVLHGLREDYDAEAQRLICDGPGWIPGIGGGKRATQAVDVTVPF